jgi:outer membrane lipoprotein-sorting protein
MIRKLFCLAALAFLAASALPAQTADEVISKYVAARGGIDKIKGVKSERITGRISFGPDIEGPFLIERQRPLKLRMEFSVQGMTLIRTYDGKSSGWIYNPMTANPSVQPMSDGDLKNIFDEADYDGPFVDYKAKGNQIELVDKEEVLGKTAYKIKLTSKNGDISYFYFDASTNLLLKWEGDRKVSTQSFPWESYFHDFREVSGLRYPFLIESDAPGTDQRQKITAENIEINIPIDPSRFGKPNPPPGPAAAAPNPNEPPVPATPPSPDSSAPPPKPNN